MSLSRSLTHLRSASPALCGATMRTRRSMAAGAKDASPAADQKPGAPGRKRLKGDKGAAANAAAAEAPAPPAAVPAAAAVEAEAEKPRKLRPRNEVAVPEPDQLCFSVGSGVHVGTSGYSYKHWRGAGGFYEGLPQRLEFERYAKEFDMVEINATFYGWFEASTYQEWRSRAAAARPSFLYVLKAPQLYSHRKRLNIDDAFRDSWGRFWERAQLLRPHLGPILFQFPANFRTTSAPKGKGQEPVNNIDKLRRLGELLPAGEKFVFEFRDASWLCQEVYDVLRQHDWCLAICHATDAPRNRKLDKAEGGWIGTLAPGPNPKPEDYPLECCSWGAYVRFHGSAGQYAGCHGQAELARWAEWAKRWRAQGREVFLAFNNDTIEPRSTLPSAILDCRTLGQALRGCGAWPPA